jgi:hypothetical protein
MRGHAQPEDSFLEDVEFFNRETGAFFLDDVTETRKKLQ